LDSISERISTSKMEVNIQSIFVELNARQRRPFICGDVKLNPSLLLSLKDVKLKSTDEKVNKVRGKGVQKPILSNSAFQFMVGNVTIGLDLVSMNDLQLKSFFDPFELRFTKATQSLPVSPQGLQTNTDVSIVCDPIRLFADLEITAILTESVKCLKGLINPQDKQLIDEESKLPAKSASIIIRNYTDLTVNYGQLGTTEKLALSSLHATAYPWRSAAGQVRCLFSLVSSSFLTNVSA